MKTIKVKAVLLTDGEHYLLHGSDAESPSAMFKAVAPIWEFDPSKETAHFVELTLHIPDWESLHPKEAVVDHQHDDLPLTLAGDDPRMSLSLDDLKLG